MLPTSSSEGRAAGEALAVGYQFVDHLEVVAHENREELAEEVLEGGCRRRRRAGAAGLTSDPAPILLNIDPVHRAVNSVSVGVNNFGDMLSNSRNTVPSRDPYNLSEA